MKNLLVLIVLILVSCNTYNDKMNGLLQKKSELESQYKVADSISADFITKNRKAINDINEKYQGQEILKVFDKWTKEINLKTESSIYKSNSDSAVIYAKNSKILLNQLKSIEYSIDSLSKLK
jgi:hypothetical protein